VPRHVAKPRLSRHKSTGQACVRIDGKDCYWGLWGTREAEERGEELIREWILKRDPDRMSIAVGELALRFRIRQNLLQRVLAQAVLLAGSTLARAVGTIALTNSFPVLQFTSHFQSTSVTSLKTGPTRPGIVPWRSVTEPMGEHFHASGYPLRVAHGSPVGLPCRASISCPSSSS
jgi:hypothetical protein